MIQLLRKDKDVEERQVAITFRTNSSQDRKIIESLLFPLDRASKKEKKSPNLSQNPPATGRI